VISIGELLDLYINDIYLYAATGRAKQYVVIMVRDCPIANVLTNELMSSDLIAKPQVSYGDGLLIKKTKLPITRNGKTPTMTIDAFLNA